MEVIIMETIVEALLDERGITKIVFGRLVDCTQDTITIITSADHKKTEVLLLSIDEILELTMVGI
jgi:acetolactate synthase small subunit